MIRRCLEQAVVTRHRFVKPSELLKRGAAIAEGVNVMPVSFQRQVDLTDCFGIISGLQKDHAEQMPAVKMIRPGGQYLIVGSFGVLQLAAAMQRQSLRKQ